MPISESKEGLDLFRLPPLKALYNSRYFPLIPQLVTLGVFILLIWGGFGLFTKDMDFAKVLRNTNLANLVVWSYWWPGVIIVAILAGRHWCTVCPMELITSLSGKFGLKRKPGRFLRSGWAITLFFAFILVVGVHTLAIHRVPGRMAVYMILLLAVAFLAGLIWEKRTFCTYICPVGHLLGLYALLSAMEWRVQSRDCCDRCKTKECIAKSRQYLITARSCTSELYPKEIRDNRKCILCSQCLSSCPHDNISLRIRKPFAGLASDPKLSSAEIGFIILLSGFVVYEIFVEWGVTKSLLLVVPNYLSENLGISGILTGTLNAMVLFIGFPILFFAFFSGFRKWASRGKIRESLAMVSLAILPVMGCTHLLKAFFKTTSRIPFWTHTIQDPKGIDTAQALISGSLHLDKTVLQTIHPAMTVIAVLLPLVGLSVSLLFIMRRRNESLLTRLITFSAVFVYFGLFEAGILAGRIL